MDTALINKAKNNFSQSPTMLVDDRRVAFIGFINKNETSHPFTGETDRPPEFLSPVEILHVASCPVTRLFYPGDSRLLNTANAHRQ